MTTLFFSPFDSDAEGPLLLGPAVGGDGKPDMWHTRGGEERVGAGLNFGCGRRVKRRKEKE